ncbi:hypothetical protein [Xenophilus sp. Marseille-Q4582]|uniref:hypothetical protein n=1 Tax=Xenophilus sp. Marseille-Q4582 TaxID=2866600 RepID=UPI001CE403CD|nr:hypothetical protein [Xenophilus sp. Marseille-Q4582]
MRPTSPLLSAPMRTGLLVLGFVLSPVGSHAQQTPGATAPAAAPVERSSEPLDGRRNQKIEHITVEDTGARVDEMRYGGVTQSITVQPKNAMPTYEVQPTDERRARQGDGSGGSRVWNVMKF